MPDEKGFLHKKCNPEISLALEKKTRTFITNFIENINDFPGTNSQKYNSICEIFLQKNKKELLSVYEEKLLW